MEISDVFIVLNIYDLSQFAGINDPLDLAPETGVTENVTNHDFALVLHGKISDGDALFHYGRNGLFKKNVIFKSESAHYVAVMLSVHGCDDHGVANFTELIKLIGIVKDM